MKYKLTLGLVVLSVAALLVAGVGCDKTTGGGWFYDCEGDKVTLGFTAQPTGEGMARGEFQLVDHGDKIKVHGKFEATIGEDGTLLGLTVFTGTCLIDGDEHFLQVSFLDLGEGGASPGDVVEILAGPYFYAGVLEGGNIQVHVPKK